MKRVMALGVAVVVVSGCGSDSSSDAKESRLSCAEDTKVVHVVDSSVGRDSYHLFTNTCNTLAYAGSFDSSGAEAWGYNTGLPVTNDWVDSIERFTLLRDSSTFDLYAGLPRLPTSDEKSQGATICLMDTIAMGTYDSASITVSSYQIDEYCYPDGGANPVVSYYDLDYSKLTQEQVERFQSIVIDGNPSKVDFDEAMASDKRMVCEVASDEEIGGTECAN